MRQSSKSAKLSACTHSDSIVKALLSIDAANQWTERARRLLVDAACDGGLLEGQGESVTPAGASVPLVVGEMLRRTRDVAMPASAPMAMTERIVVLLSNDGVSQRTAVKEVINSGATWLVEAPDGQITDALRVFQWVPGTEDTVSVTRRFAQERPVARKLASSQAWREPRVCRLLNGQFQSVSRSCYKKMLSGTDIPLRLYIVAHGTTRGESAAVGVRRTLDRVDAPDLVGFLMRNVFRHLPGKGKSHTSGVTIDMVACALSVPGECLTDASSFVGCFLKALADCDPSLAERSTIVASTFKIGYPAHGFERAQQITISGRDLIFPESMLTQFGISHRFMAILPKASLGRREPIRISFVQHDFLQQEFVVLDAFVAAYEHWQRVEGWHAHELSSRFVLFELMADLTFTLDHPSDIAIVRTFVERLMIRRTPSMSVPSEGTNATVSIEGGTTEGVAPMSEVLSGAHDDRSVFERTTSLRIDGGVIRLFADATSQTPLAVFDLKDDIGLFGITLFKYATSTHLIDELSDAERQTLRRYLLTQVRLLDNGIYRWIGVPETGREFVARWRGRWAAAPDDQMARTPPGYMGGELFNALLKTAWIHGRTDDVQALAALTLPGGVFDASSAVMRLNGFNEQAGLHIGRTGGWYVHARHDGVQGCRAIPRSAEWEVVFGEIGAAVGSMIRADLMKADDLRWRLLKMARDTVASGHSNPLLSRNDGLSVSTSASHAGSTGIDPALSASSVWQRGLSGRASYFPCTPARR